MLWFMTSSSGGSGGDVGSFVLTTEDNIYLSTEAGETILWE